MIVMPKSTPVFLIAALLLAVALLGVQLFQLRDLVDEIQVKLSEEQVRSKKDIRPGSDLCPRTRPSALATKYLETLHGVEIGASTQNSFRLKRSVNVDFSDEQGGLWQHKGCEPATVNIVALGDDLPFKDNTLDYVLSSHVMEHFFDPVKALREWHRVIKPGGYIYIIAPHMDRTFDKHREPTPVAELIDRSTGKLKVSNYAKPLNQKALEGTGKEKLGNFAEVMPQRLVRDKGKTPLGADWAYYDSDDHHHWSVWRTDDFVALIKQLKFNIIEVQDSDDKVGNGFAVVIQK
jgi:SAM-dependent methyltransferase